MSYHIKTPKLLSRDDFRNKVFERDNFTCVVCKKKPAKDAHHIIERRLWQDGGYYLENGASVCEECHIKCEQTLIECDYLRTVCGITKVVVPEHLYCENGWQYDKWGNPILPNGTRMKGELFDDPSVQKVLEPVFHLFTNRIKYPRTYHLPWSESVSKDDRVVSEEDLKENLVGKEIVVTRKMDGECTTFYKDGIHARSLSYEPHPSRDWVRALHGRIAWEIPENWRICGENLYAKHSIGYKNLEDYFQVFSIWDGLKCLSWEETKQWCNVFYLKTVPEIYVGDIFPWNGQGIDWKTYKGDEMEGYVIRLADSFHYSTFRKNVAKFVRKNHVTTHGHWMRSKVIPNLVAKEQEEIT